MRCGAHAVNTIPASKGTIMTTSSGVWDVTPPASSGRTTPGTERPFAFRLAIVLIAALCLHARPTCGWGQIAVDGCYWQYNGQRVLLLGGWNHGHNPFIDHDTDNDRDNQGVSSPEQITAAMDELVEAGGNYLRCVLNPGMASAIQRMPFCAHRDGQYDLNSMTGPFWTRLETFLREAQRRDIIVQIELWDRFDLIDGSWGAWPGSPWNPQNNINYTTASSGLETSYGSFARRPLLHGVPGHPIYEQAAPARKEKYDLVRSYQNKFVDRLLAISLTCDNVLYCMNNETHVHPAWGQYWIDYIRATARARGKRVFATDMFDNVYAAQESEKLAYQLSHRDQYDYIDISQANSRHADQTHWDRVCWIVQAARKADPPYLAHMTKVYGNDLALDGKPWSRFRPGDSDNAIEEWWRNLLAGVAGVRFHRPTAGIGLSALSKACMTATRKVEADVKLWDVAPRLDLLAHRGDDEAYLAADPGQAYILYFTKNGEGSVGLKLDDHPNATFRLRWVNIDTGKLGPTAILPGGDTVPIQRPSDASHWVATIVRRTGQE
jgi:hypothetical protein